MTTVLVTGGAGFIGSNIVEVLLKQGYEVKILDNLSTGKEENIQPGADFIKGDIRNSEVVRKSMEDVDYVLHQAALASVSRSVEDPATTTDVNVNGTLQILLAARDAGVKRVVYASSSSVYGDESTLPKVETMPPSPLSPYAVSKLTPEYFCYVFYDVFGLETVSLRYFNVYGPRQNPESKYAAVIPKFMTAMMRDKRPVIFGDGNQTRDFTYVKDVVEANILAMKAKDASGKVFNIGVGKSITINKLVNILNDILGKGIKPEYTEPREGDVKHSLADISLARKILGYEPRYDVMRGLRETVKFYGL